MKKLLLLSAFIIPVLCTAQGISFTSATTNIADSIALKISNAALNKTVDSAGSMFNRTFVAAYDLPNNELLKIHFIRNKDTYVIIQLEGNFDALFSFWKAYIEADADAKHITADHHAKPKIFQYGSDKQIVFALVQNSSDNWQINRRDY